MSSEFPQNSCQKRRNLQQNSFGIPPNILKKTNQYSSRKSSQLRRFSHNLEKNIYYPLCMRQTCSGKLHNKKILKKTWVRIWPMEPNTWAFLERYMSGKLNTSQHCKSYFMRRKKSPDDWHSIPCLLANNLDSFYNCSFRITFFISKVETISFTLVLKWLTLFKVNSLSQFYFPGLFHFYTFIDNGDNLNM